MPLELDHTDIAILRALMEDGRRSFREIAQSIEVSAPTVESRVKRLFQTGIIRKIAPILDLEKIEGRVSALILLKVDLQELEDVTKRLVPLEETRSIFVTTGEANLVVKITSSSNEKIQSFLGSQISGLKGVSVVSTQIITRSFKDEQGVPLGASLSVSLNCDFCGGEIKGSPFTLNVGDGKRFFCCKVCLGSYKEKYGARITKLTS